MKHDRRWVFACLAALALLTGAASAMASPRRAEAPKDPFAAFVRASGTVSQDGQAYRVEFLVDGSDAMVRITKAGDAPRYYDATTVDSILALFADTRASFLWPALTAWAGPDLGILRARNVAAAEATWKTGKRPLSVMSMAEASTPPRSRALLQYAATLASAGYLEQARRVLADERVKMKRRSERQQLEWLTVSLAIAKYDRALGRLDQALSELAEDDAAFGPDNPYGVNFEINRAAALAEAGRAADALVAIDQAQRRFDAPVQKGFGGERVAGSHREFDWIRACALSRLGREPEAKQLLAATFAAPDPTDDYFPIPDSATLRLRAAVCMGDAAGIVNALLESPAPVVGGAAVLWMQPDYARTGVDAALLAAVQADPRMRAAATAHFRILPASMTPALTRWGVLRPLDGGGSLQ